MSRENLKKWKMALGAVDLDHCSQLHRAWHELRSDIEHEVFLRTVDELIKNLTDGQHEPDIYMGHCRNESEYISMQELSSNMEDMSEILYGSSE